MLQTYYQFHDPASPPTPEERRWAVDRSNPDCPFSKFIGNDKALRILQGAAFKALSHPLHQISDQFFAIFGPSSTGKTTLAKMFADTLEIPFIEIHPRAVNSALDIMVKAAEVFENYSPIPGGTLELQPYCPGGVRQPNTFRFPPCVIFLDEIHLMTPKLVQSLLKATDKNNPVLDTGKYTIKCDCVCWMCATTDRGLLFDAFDSRFIKVNLELYSKAELAQIVGIHNPTFNDALCELVAFYGSHVPREALDFARQMRIEMEMEPADWEDVAKRVASNNGIDEFGMTEQRVRILKALSKGPVSKDHMCLVAGCKVEELERFVMPALLVELVTVGPRGYVITAAGLKELELREN